MINLYRVTTKTEDAIWFTLIKDAKQSARETEGKVDRILFNGNERELLASALSSDGRITQHIEVEEEIFISREWRLLTGR